MEWKPGQPIGETLRAGPPTRQSSFGFPFPSGMFDRGIPFA